MIPPAAFLERLSKELESALTRLVRPCGSEGCST
jgi:hypothetical protein